ncbi:MAG: hypothetical protein NTW10_12540 [Bacteroidetes bacterium]|nr:hypothetical protein [Bacteroidota bacterium]
MKRKFKYQELFLAGWMLLLLLPSCTLEKKLGKEFLTQAPQICIEVYTPENLYKFSHKGEIIAGFDSLSSTQQDSALYASSRFIRYTDDSVFLDRYVNSFIDELRSIGFRVFVDSSVDTILRTQPQAYVVNMSQIQMDEYFEPFEDSEPVGDTVFHKSFELNAVDASSWFELSKYNVVKPVKTILYSSFTASDGFAGNFVMNGFSMDIQYRYKIDSLRMSDIYDLASYSGRHNAVYLFDYFMNQFIAYHMPEGFEIMGYLHYNPSRKTFDFTDEEKFEVLKNK